MLRTEWVFVFGLVLVLVGAQQEPAARPRPSQTPRSSGSYSDFPGSLAANNPVQTNNGQSKVGPTSIPSRVVKQFAGSIVIPASSSSYSLIPRNVGPKSVPTQSSSFSAVPKSVQGIPVSAVAASELAQGIVKPKPPLKTGTDTWTPMGFTGNGKTYEAATGSSSQQLPYDASQSKQTIGEQIMQRQQKQQQQQPPQQYDIFGFPINNSPDPFADLFGLTPSNSLFGPMPVSQDPFFGSFGGAVGGSNQGGQGMGGHGPMGNMLQAMLLMQLFGDAPDPQPRRSGRGRAAQAQLTPTSALDQLMRLEEIRMMRNRQRARVNRNRRMPENQRRGAFARRPPPPPRNKPQNPTQAPVNRMQQKRYGPALGTANTIPKPPKTRSSAVVLRPGSSPRRRAQPTAPARRSLHPEVLDRRNMPTTPAPTQQGQEPVEREGPRQTQTAPQAERQPSFRQSTIERRVLHGFNQQRRAPAMPYKAPSPVSGTNFDQGYNTFQDPVQGNAQQYQQPYSNPMATAGEHLQYHQPNENPMARGGQQLQQNRQPYSHPSTYGGQRFTRRNRGQNTIPRNIQQLVNNPLFQRRLRTAGATPGANPADVRADRADLMADRADNLQAMNPLQRMLGMAMSGARDGVQAGQTSGTGISALTNLFGSGGPGSLLALGLMGGGL